MTDATRAVLSRIDMALAADESAEAVAWLEADFERKYAAYQAGEWRPSNCARPIMELLDDSTGGPAGVAVVSMTLDASAFIEAMQRAAESVALTMQRVGDSLAKFSAACAEMTDDTERAAMRADYDRRRRARRRKKRR